MHNDDHVLRVRGYDTLTLVFVILKREYLTLLLTFFLFRYYIAAFPS